MAITQDSRVSSAKFSTELHNSNYRLRVDASLRRYREREGISKGFIRFHGARPFRRGRLIIHGIPVILGLDMAI